MRRSALGGPTCSRPAPGLGAAGRGRVRLSLPVSRGIAPARMGRPVPRVETSGVASTPRPRHRQERSERQAQTGRAEDAAEWSSGGTDGPAVDALLRTGRFLTRHETTDALRAVFRAGGRAGNVFYRDRWSHDKVVRSPHGVNGGWVGRRRCRREVVRRIVDERAAGSRLRVIAEGLSADGRAYCAGWRGVVDQQRAGSACRAGRGPTDRDPQPTGLNHTGDHREHRHPPEQVRARTSRRSDGTSTALRAVQWAAAEASCAAPGCRSCMPLPTPPTRPRPRAATRRPDPRPRLHRRPSSRTRGADLHGHHGGTASAVAARRVRSGRAARGRNGRCRPLRGTSSSDRPRRRSAGGQLPGSSSSADAVTRAARTGRSWSASTT